MWPALLVFSGSFALGGVLAYCCCHSLRWLIDNAPRAAAGRWLLTRLGLLLAGLVLSFVLILLSAGPGSLVAAVGGALLGRFSHEHHANLRINRKAA